MPYYFPALFCDYYHHIYIYDRVALRIVEGCHEKCSVCQSTLLYTANIN